jgi:hypothetical protein
MTPPETKKEIAIPNVHSILYWVDKKDPLGPAPINPADDYQFNSWEYGVQKWLAANPQASSTKPVEYDNLHTEQNKPVVTILSPKVNDAFGKDSRVTAVFSITAPFPIKKVAFYLNNELIEMFDTPQYVLNFVPSSVNSVITNTNIFKVIVYDNFYNQGEASVNIQIK